MKDLLVLAGLGAFGALIATTHPLSSEMVIFVANTISLIHNLYLTLAPSKACALYGLASTPFRNFILERCGMINLSLAVTAWMLFGRKVGASDAVAAVGMGALVTAIVMTKSVLNEEWKPFGGKALPHYLLAFVSVGASYFCLFAGQEDEGVNGEARDLFIKLLFFLRIAHGFMFSVFPEKVSQSYGGIDVSDGGGLHDVQMMGIFCLAYGIFVAAVYLEQLGLTKEQAFGWSYVPILVSGMVNHFVLEKGGEGEDNLKYAWMVLQLLVVGTLLVGGGEGAEA